MRALWATDPATLSALQSESAGPRLLLAAPGGLQGPGAPEEAEDLCGGM